MMMNKTRGTLEFGPYRLESGPYRLWRGSKEIALRPKSLKVLAYLARHPGRLVTKEELREQVWSATHVSDTRLRVTVSEVRAALGDDQDSPAYLKTVPGRGYRFVATNETTALDDARSTLDELLRGGPKPVVGRERELEHLVNRFLEANRGERRLIFLGGDPGVGKTTLVNLFLEHLAGRPHTTCTRGQCVMHYGSGEAYAPVLEALVRVGHEGFGRALIQVLERCAPMWLVQLPALVESEELERLQRQVQGATRDRMVRELNDALERLTAKDTLVLVLEDLHWSDLATLDLLTAIAQRPEPARLLIIGTYRPAEAIVSAPTFRAMMRELEGRGLCEQFDLELLTFGDVAAYVRARIDGESTEDVATAIYERSDGNALFMVNLFEHLIEAHSIRRRDGRWVVDGTSAALTQIPQGLRPFIECRLDVLSDKDREFLEVASVVGVEFAAAAVYAGLPRSGEEQDLERIETRLDSLLSHAHLIAPCGTTEWPDGTITASYRFGHALYRDGLYERIPEARRTRLHRRVGERLQSAWGGDSREMAAALADHFERGRAPENAARYRRMAGERALGKHAYHAATQQFQAALKAFDQARNRPADGDSEDAVRWELEVYTMLSTALSASRGYSDPKVRTINSRARSLIEHIDDPTIQFPALFNLWLLTAAAADFAENANLVTQMSELAAGTENDELAMMYSSAKSRTQFYLGDLAGCDEHMRRIFTAYDPLRLADVHSRYTVVEHAIGCLGVNGWLLWLQGYPDQALARVWETDELAECLDGPYYEAVAGYLALPTLQFCGDTAQLERRARDTHRCCSEQGYSLWLAWATCFEGWAVGARGDVAEGIALMERGVDAWRATGSRSHLPHCLALLAELYLCVGRIEAASERLAEARARAESSGERYWEAELHRLQGEVLLAAAGDGGGHGDPAEACFRRALEVAGRQGATSLELRAALSLSRLGSSPDAHQLLREVMGRFTEGHETADLRAAQTQLALI
jgi:DNA-binding winged helix-turn-helix (wHTH) protein/tetratricopeptide (TPR) repeat protein